MFWIVAGLVLVVTILTIVGGLGRGVAQGTRADVAVYRDQLRELERDTARGTLQPEEAEAARAEVARRLLAADKAADREPRAKGNVMLGLMLVAVPVVLISGGVYYWLGAAGYPDFPLEQRIARIEENRATRPDQATAEATVEDEIDESRPDVTAMASQLKQVLAQRPDDLRGWRLAVQTQAGIGDLESAWRSQDQVIEILGEEAVAEDFALKAELMILAAGGYVSPEAETALSQAVTLDRANGTARYYAGLMYAQGGRADRAFSIWRSLIAESTPDAPWLDAIYARIEEISVLAGDPTPIEELPQPRGPSADDLLAAEDLTPAARIEMIGNMVQGLAERLSTEGGTANDWGRLISSYGVLGRTDAAAAVFAEAQQVFAADPAALDVLFRAADRAGVNP